MEKKKAQELNLDMMDKVSGGGAGNEPHVNTVTCPHCGQRFPSSIGIMSFDCPHCGKPIPAEMKNGGDTIDPGKEKFLLF